MSILSAALGQWGAPVVLFSGGETRTVQAMVQPAFSKASMETKESAAGRRDLGECIYIGPPEAVLHTGDALQWQGKDFRVVRAALWHLGNNPHHCWALLVPLPGGRL